MREPGLLKLEHSEVSLLLGDALLSPELLDVLTDDSGLIVHGTNPSDVCFEPPIVLLPGRMNQGFKLGCSPGEYSEEPVWDWGARLCPRGECEGVGDKGDISLGVTFGGTSHSS